MESLKYLSGNNSLFKELLAIFLLFGIVPDCWKDIVPEELFYFLSFFLQLENLIIVRMALISFIHMVQEDASRENKLPMVIFLFSVTKI